MCSENLSISEKWDKFIATPAWVFVKKLTVHENLKKREHVKSWSSFSKYIHFHLELFEIQSYRRFTQLKKKF